MYVKFCAFLHFLMHIQRVIEDYFTHCLHDHSVPDRCGQDVTGESTGRQSNALVADVLHGEDLAAAYASIDIFVRPSASETVR